MFVDTVRAECRSLHRGASTFTPWNVAAAAGKADTAAAAGAGGAEAAADAAEAAAAADETAGR